MLILKKIILIYFAAQIILINTYCFCHDEHFIPAGKYGVISGNRESNHHEHSNIEHNAVHNFFNNSNDSNDLNIKKLSFFDHNCENTLLFSNIPIESQISEFDLSIFLVEESIPLYLNNSELII